MRRLRLLKLPASGEGTKAAALRFKSSVNTASRTDRKGKKEKRRSSSRHTNRHVHKTRPTIEPAHSHSQHGKGGTTGHGFSWVSLLGHPPLRSLRRDKSI